MKKILNKIVSLLPTKRKLIQLYTALLFNANFKGFISGNIYRGASKNVCVPGINCYSCPGAVGACPLGSLQGSFSADRSTLFYVGGIILLYSFLFGRMICGWLCPFGLIQELLFKIRTPKLKKNHVTRVLSYLKYVILVVFVFIIPIMYAFRNTPLPAFCKYICPAGTLEGGIGLLANKVNDSYFSMLGPLFTWKFLILVSIVAGSIFVFRIFCRFICPLGALYGLFNKISLFGVQIEKPKCTGCNLCVSHCKLDIKTVGDQECISCGECIDVCPTKAISFKGKAIFVKSNDIPKTTEKNTKTAKIITRSISVLLLVSLLVATIAYTWNDAPNVQNPPEQNDTADEGSSSSPENNIIQGNEVGNLCYGADLSIITPDGISSQTINPVATGRITIINFWGTWCTPCVAELPYFDQIATEYADTVSVIAVHTNMVSDTAPGYINNYYPDSKITFACDLDNEGYYSKLGGRGTYPYTVIIDENGIIAQVFVKALKHEDLKNAVDAILNK